MKKIWFRRKLYGWGWYPSSWQGWLVILVWLLAVISFTATISNIDHEGFKNLIFVILSIFVLIYICYKKGEKPRWQWGKRIEDLPDNQNKQK